VTGRTIALTIVGFLVGMLAAGGIGVRVIEEVRAEDDATSLPAENVASSDRVIIASSLVAPTSVVEADSSVAIEYDIVSFAPTAGFSAAELAFLYPKSWSLTLESGTVDGGPADPGTGVAVFAVPVNTGTADIRSVDVVDPLAPYPLDVSFVLSQAVPSVVVTDGVRADLVSVTVQSDSATVQIDLVANDPIDLAFVVEGVGGGWRSASIQPGGATVELLWVGGDLPDVLTFRAVGIQWVEIEGLFPVSPVGIG
jgi:hypothetical protein